jgi:hypothetical protein
MSDTPPSQDPSPPTRTPGIVVASIVAVAVFALGNLIVNRLTTNVELPPPPALAGQPGALPTASSSAASGQPSPVAAPSGDGGPGIGSRDAAVRESQERDDAGGAPTAAPALHHAKDGLANGDAATQAHLGEGAGAAGPPQAVEEVTPPVDERSPRGAKREDEGDRPARKGSSGNCALADKDIAREAWRRNAPTICVTGDGKDQAALYLPVKGNAMSATYDFRRRQKLLRILAPAAESQLTMAQYKLRRHGFRDLRIGGESQGGDGAKLRITFEKNPADVAVELKETFIKVVIPLPTSGSTSGSP